MEQLQSQSLEVRRQIAELDVQHSGIVAEIVTTSQVGISYDDNAGGSTGRKRALSDVLDVTKKNDRRTPEGVLLEIPDDTSSN